MSVTVVSVKFEMYVFLFACSSALEKLSALLYSNKITSVGRGTRFVAIVGFFKYSASFIDMASPSVAVARIMTSAFFRTAKKEWISDIKITFLNGLL